MGERNFSYLKEIQPIWDRHCISCHDGVKQPMSLKGELKVMDKPSKRKYTDSYLSLTHATQNKDGGAWRGNAHHREANNWSQKDLDFYNYYDKKREAARAEDQENIRQYIQSLQTKQEKK